MRGIGCKAALRRKSSPEAIQGTIHCIYEWTNLASYTARSDAGCWITRACHGRLTGSPRERAQAPRAYQPNQGDCRDNERNQHKKVLIRLPE